MLGVWFKHPLKLGRNAYGGNIYYSLPDLKAYTYRYEIELTFYTS